MTRKHFELAAAMIRAIAAEEWTFDPPPWADDRYLEPLNPSSDAHYTRAVQTSEAFVILFERFNPRFNRRRFLEECGLTVED